MAYDDNFGKNDDFYNNPAYLYFNETEEEIKAREKRKREKQERRDEKQRERDAKAKKKQEEHEALMRELNAITKEKYEEVDTSKPREEVSRELHENLKKATKMFVVNSLVVLVSLGAAALVYYTMSGALSIYNERRSFLIQCSGAPAELNGYFGG